MMINTSDPNPAPKAQKASLTLDLVTKSRTECYCLSDDYSDTIEVECSSDACKEEVGYKLVVERSKVQWWQMSTIAKTGNLNTTSDFKDQIIIISDKTGPESLSWLTGYGVIGLYLSVVLLCGRYTRAIFQYDGAYIMFHEYPNVDDMIQLCLGKIFVLN